MSPAKPPRSEPLFAKGAQSDPAMVAFIDAIIGLSLAQWNEVVSRYDRLGKPARDAAVNELASVLFDGRMGRLDRPERFTAREDSAREQRDRATAALQAIPLERELDGRTIPLRASAVFATLHAWQAIQVHGWLIGHEKTEKAARTAYAPFEGMALLPLIPARAAKHE